MERDKNILPKDRLDDDDSTPPINSKHADTTADSGHSLDRWMEGMVRVTLSGLGGSMVGLAYQRQQSALDPSPSKRRIAPAAKRRLASQQFNLPRTWAISCMLFTLLLESSRMASPMTLLMNGYYLETDDDKGKSFQGKAQRTALVSIGDYAFGGMMAGVAGVSGQRNLPKSSSAGGIPLQLPDAILKSGRRPLLMWGLGMGLALGFSAGILQAVVDVGSLYIEERRAIE